MTASIPTTRELIHTFTGPSMTATVEHEPANYMGLGGFAKYVVKVEDHTVPALSDEWAQTFTTLCFTTENDAVEYARLGADADPSDF